MNDAPSIRSPAAPQPRSPAWRVRRSIGRYLVTAIVMAAAYGPAPPDVRAQLLSERGQREDELGKILRLTAAVVRGRVTDISYTFDADAGPRTVVALEGSVSLVGRVPAGPLQIRQYGGPLPDGRFATIADQPTFVVGAEYVLFLTSSEWYYSPLVRDLAFRVEQVGSKEVLVSNWGCAVHGFSPRGIYMGGPALFESARDHANPSARPVLLPGAEGAVDNAISPSQFVLGLQDEAARRDIMFDRAFNPSPEPRTWNAPIPVVAPPQDKGVSK